MVGPNGMHIPYTHSMILRCFQEISWGFWGILGRSGPKVPKKWRLVPDFSWRLDSLITVTVKSPGVMLHSAWLMIPTYSNGVFLANFAEKKQCLLMVTSQMWLMIKPYILRLFLNHHLWLNFRGISVGNSWLFVVALHPYSIPVIMGFTGLWTMN